MPVRMCWCAGCFLAWDRLQVAWIPIGHRWWSWLCFPASACFWGLWELLSVEDAVGVWWPEPVASSRLSIVVLPNGMTDLLESRGGALGAWLKGQEHVLLCPGISYCWWSVQGKYRKAGSWTCQVAEDMAFWSSFTFQQLWSIGGFILRLSFSVFINVCLLLLANQSIVVALLFRKDEFLL